MMRLLPIRRLRIDTTTEFHTFNSGNQQIFEYYQFEPGTYTKSQLTYTYQNGQVMPYAVREEVVVDLVDFSPTQLDILFSWERCDVEVTLGLPGETDKVIYFYDVAPQRNYNVSDGLQKVKLSIQQTTSIHSWVETPYTGVNLAVGTADGMFSVIGSLRIIDCRVGMQVIKLPYRNGTYTDIERVIGYKRKAIITVSPVNLTSRNGFSETIERWLLAPYKGLWAWNFFIESEDDELGLPRPVVCTNSEEIMEERLDNLYYGRNITIEVLDRAINPLPAS